jgi:hypothetical protein
LTVFSENQTPRENSGRFSAHPVKIQFEETGFRAFQKYSRKDIRAVKGGISEGLKSLSMGTI